MAKNLLGLKMEADKYFKEKEKKTTPRLPLTRSEIERMKNFLEPEEVEMINQAYPPENKPNK
jgi:hypothetical protein